MSGGGLFQDSELAVLRRSIELNPQSWYAHSNRGEILGTQGRSEEGFEEAKIALELDPLSPMVRAFYGIMLAATRRIEEALTAFEASVQSRDYLLPAFFTLTELFPWMADIRATPRFRALRAKVKFV